MSPVQNSMQVPVMKPEHIALSLRLTCGLNSKLQQGSACDGVHIWTSPQSHQIPHSAGTRPECITIFHARTLSSLDDADLGGTERWRSSLNEFTRQIMEDTFDLSENESSVVLSLAMIYLDRASSVETQRSNGMPPCPFCSFQTVRRLLLTAILSAARVVKGKSTLLGQEQLDFYGLCIRGVTEMLAWFEASLGDRGHFVSTEEMRSFKAWWEKTFFEGEPGSQLDRHESQQKENASSLQDTRDTASEQAADGAFSGTRDRVPATEMQQTHAQKHSASGSLYGFGHLTDARVHATG